ncbi:MAG TPA: DUF924 family protein [Stellaceae bacterium]|nr:DUF924 family protein [Stellaceae bacterium]
MAEPQDILDFWFGAPGSPECAGPRKIWFKSDASFDSACRENFAALSAEAREGALDHWRESAEGALALVLLLDQMPRNIHRGSALAFACDAKARWAAREAVARGFDRDLPPHRRQFLYLPFEHSENLADQEEGLHLFGSLPEGEHRERQLDYARRHQVVIARFGRFPHRNVALGRVSTAEEEAFLASPTAPY